MERISFFVDGFNLYYAVKHQFKGKYKWLDLNKLCRAFITKNQSVEKIFYFTAYFTYNIHKTNRHVRYIKALRTVGAIPVFGVFKKRDRWCPLCNKKFIGYEEKRTDVNIAVYLIQEAVHDTYDKAFVVSGDGDLVPAIEGVKKLFPDKGITIILPPGRPAKDLIGAADPPARKIKEKHLRTCQFPNPITDGKDQPILHKPSEWK